MNFETLAPLGAGGMAEVFLARMRQGDEEGLVALKRLWPPLLVQSDFVAQFEREARIGALLRHPNIVTLRAYGRDGQGPFLAFEYVDGLSVSQLLDAYGGRDQPLPLEVALCIARDAARGLSYAHGWVDESNQGVGVVHRDVSPDNLLIASNGVTKVADFGIATFLGSTRITRTGTFKGKFAFTAPELFEGLPATFRSDHFSLAATLFQLFCGVRPFLGSTEAEVMRAILSAEPPRTSSFRRDVPKGVDAWIFQALAKEPAARPEDLSTLLRALDEALPSQEAVARKPVADAIATLPTGPQVAQKIATQRNIFLTQVAQPKRRSAVGRRAAAGVAILLLVIGGPLIARWITAPTAPTPERPHAGAAPTPSVPFSPQAGSKKESPKRDPTQQEAAAEGPLTEPEPSPSPQARPIVRTKTKLPSPRPGVGTLNLKVRPWGRVFVDGVLRGVTPLEPLSLSTGHHAVIVVNEELQVRRSYQVQVETGRITELKVLLDQP